MHKAMVKICGLQDVEVLKSMVQLPLNYIGLVFAPSRRRVSPERASELLTVLAEWEHEEAPLAVGVFVNPTLVELRELLSKVLLDVIQLHGDESPEFCREVKMAFPQVQLWKAFSVSVNHNDILERNSSARFINYADAVDAFLLDTLDPHQKGGSGRTFAWEEITSYKERASGLGLPLFVAGGLHPGNVSELLCGFAPDGVDVSSGVETDGVKDIVKMTAFVERVKQS